ncbi:uncharacterized protein [Venturia canescens]|uniref:uncharacterized protein n=1 Tax=Venturia canescens TaxID=32260 RepID=UPI001C9CD744|nr:uncharacterized protein LOC122411150 [Venturia canescens]
MQNIKVPLKSNDFEKYHSKCYRQFTALPPKYRRAVETPSTSAAASSETDAQTSEAAEHQNKNIDVSSNFAESQIISPHASSSIGDQSDVLNSVSIEEAEEDAHDSTEQPFSTINCAGQIVGTHSSHRSPHKAKEKNGTNYEMSTKKRLSKYVALFQKISLKKTILFLRQSKNIN